jgi:cobalamin biosynthesis protein CobT
MLSSLLRPKKGRRRVEQYSPFSSRYDDQSSPIVERRKRLDARHATADFTETDPDDENTEEEDDEEDGEQEGEGGEDDDHGEDGEDGQEHSPLLPIFSAAHLGKHALIAHL